MTYHSPTYGRLYPVFDPARGYEISLVNQWLNLTPGTIIRSDKNQSIFVIHPGKRNLHEGPDMFDASIQIDGEILTGNIECHVESKDWFTHGHDKDHAYDSVILHVVRHVNPNAPKPNIPTVVLEQPKQEKGQVACSVENISVPTETLSSLHYLAELRWQFHVQRLLEKQSMTAQGLLILSAGILGVGRNKEGFIHLSKSLDITQLKKLSRAEGMKVLKKAAETLSIRWYKKGVRPASHPEKRLEVLIEIIRFSVGLISDDLPSPNALREHLMDKLKRVCGEGVITELLGNVFFPYLGAKAVLDHDVSLFTSTRDAWFELRLPYSYMKFDKQFRGVFSSPDLRSFSFLQALKSLDKYYCQYRYCKLCPIKEGDGDLL